MVPQAGGHRCKGRPKNTTRRRRCGDFLRLAQRTLVSFGNHTCNFAIMFGVSIIILLFKIALKEVYICVLVE